MRLAYLSGSTVPSRAANGIHVMKMSAAFAAHGVEVLLITTDRPGEPAAGDPYAFYGVPETFSLQKAAWPVVKGRGYLYGLDAARHAKRFGPDVVFCRHLPGCCAAAARGLPVVFEAHHPVRGTHPFYHSMLRWLSGSSRLRRLVVISRALRDHYAENYPRLEGRIVVAPDGAGLPAADAEPLMLGDGRLKVGYVGHLYEGRGVDLLVEVAKRCPWADIHLVGGTEEDVRRWRERAEDIDNVRIHGFQPPATTDSYRLAMDVLVAPYQERVSVRGSHLDTARWMSPLKIFEYMAAGRAIIASDMPAIREVLDGDNAVLVPSGSVERWVDALQRTRDPDLRHRLAVRARRDFEERYSWSARAALLLRECAGADTAGNSPA